MSVENRRSLEQILRLDANNPSDWEILQTEYVATDIHKLYIDENEFSNYGQFQFIWEKSFIESPTRATDGSMGNINNHATIITPHLVVNFSIMSIDDYRKLMQLHYQQNEHIVKAYDPIYNQTIKVKMYFATEEMAKLYTISKIRFNGSEWENFVELAGVQDYNVELIGTNNDLSLITLSYNYNPPLDENNNPIYPNGIIVDNEAETNVYRGEEVVVGASSTFQGNPPNSTFKFKYWVDNKGTVYTDGIAITLNNPLTLYAVWEARTSFTLSFNYGLSKPYQEGTDPTTNEPIYTYNKSVQYGNSVGALPTFEDYPTVKIKTIFDTEEKTYTPYYNGAWHKNPSKSSEIITPTTLYWLQRDTTIYALYDKKPFNVRYIVNNSSLSNFNQTNYYGETVYLPKLFANGYAFNGWYIDEDFNTKFSGTMPPMDITLYAKWVEND